MTDEEKTAPVMRGQGRGEFRQDQHRLWHGRRHRPRYFADEGRDPGDDEGQASGGMRTLADVLPNLEAGADRLGVSASIAILEGLE